jgi:hypothetical protein
LTLKVDFFIEINLKTGFEIIVTNIFLEPNNHNHGNTYKMDRFCCIPAIKKPFPSIPKKTNASISSQSPK